MKKNSKSELWKFSRLCTLSAPLLQGMKLVDTPEESESVGLLSLKDVLTCKDIKKRAE